MNKEHKCYNKMNQKTKMKYKWFMKIGNVFLIFLNRRI